MKSSSVAMFIFSVMLVLGLLSAVFPAEGLAVGKLQLGFPSLEETLSGQAACDSPDQEEVETPEQILARRLAELRAAEESHFIDFAHNSPTRIFFPDGDISLFDGFFDSLDSALVQPVRIVYYGDSQLEEDRITNNVREQLQSRFGGCGVGMMPLVQTYTTLTMKQRRSSGAPRSIVYGAKEFSVPAGRYGPMGQAARLSGSMDLSYSPNTRLPQDHHARRCERITILTDTARAPLSVTCASAPVRLDSVRGAMRRYVIELPDSVETPQFRLSGSADVYGVMLDGRAGVSVDNVAMRGCSGTIFTRIDAGQLADFYTRENVRLIVLQYGGNAVPYMRVGKGLDAFAEKICTQIRYVREQAPDAAILFIGPSDMSTNIGGAMRTYPALPAIIDTLRNCANRSGAAYWDLYTVMGGQNSMVEWSRSGYAGKDYIHFTHKGADEVGNLLAQSLLLYYEYYKWRTKPIAEQLAPEVINRLLCEPAADSSSLELAPEDVTQLTGGDESFPADSL